MNLSHGALEKALLELSSEDTDGSPKPTEEAHDEFTPLQANLDDSNAGENVSASHCTNGATSFLSQHSLSEYDMTHNTKLDTLMQYSLSDAGTPYRNGQFSLTQHSIMDSTADMAEKTEGPSQYVIDDTQEGSQIAENGHKPSGHDINVPDMGQGEGQTSPNGDLSERSSGVGSVIDVSDLLAGAGVHGYMSYDERSRLIADNQQIGSRSLDSGLESHVKLDSQSMEVEKVANGHHSLSTSSRSTLSQLSTEQPPLMAFTMDKPTTDQFVALPVDDRQSLDSYKSLDKFDASMQQSQENTDTKSVGSGHSLDRVERVSEGSRKSLVGLESNSQRMDIVSVGSGKSLVRLESDSPRVDKVSLGSSKSLTGLECDNPRIDRVSMGSRKSLVGLESDSHNQIGSRDSNIEGQEDETVDVIRKSSVSSGRVDTDTSYPLRADPSTLDFMAVEPRQSDPNSLSQMEKDRLAMAGFAVDDSFKYVDSRSDLPLGLERRSEPDQDRSQDLEEDNIARHRSQGHLPSNWASQERTLTDRPPLSRYSSRGNLPPSGRSSRHEGLTDTDRSLTGKESSRSDSQERNVADRISDRHLAGSTSISRHSSREHVSDSQPGSRHSLSRHSSSDRLSETGRLSASGHSSRERLDLTTEPGRQSLSRHSSKDRLDHTSEPGRDNLSRHSSRDGLDHTSELGRESLSRHSSRDKLNHTSETGKDNLSRHNSRDRLDYRSEPGRQSLSKHSSRDRLDHTSEPGRESLSHHSSREILSMDHRSDHGRDNVSRHSSKERLHMDKERDNLSHHSSRERLSLGQGSQTAREGASPFGQGSHHSSSDLGSRHSLSSLHDKSCEPGKTSLEVESILSDSVQRDRQYVEETRSAAEGLTADSLPRRWEMMDSNDRHSSRSRVSTTQSWRDYTGRDERMGVGQESMADREGLASTRESLDMLSQRGSEHRYDDDRMSLGSQKSSLTDRVASLLAEATLTEVDVGLERTASTGADRVAEGGYSRPRSRASDISSGAFSRPRSTGAEVSQAKSHLDDYSGSHSRPLSRSSETPSINSRPRSRTDDYPERPNGRSSKITGSDSRPRSRAESLGESQSRPRSRTSVHSDIETQPRGVTEGYAEDTGSSSRPRSRASSVKSDRSHHSGRSNGPRDLTTDAASVDSSDILYSLRINSTPQIHSPHASPTSSYNELAKLKSLQGSPNSRYSDGGSTDYNELPDELASNKPGVSDIAEEPQNPSSRTSSIMTEDTLDLDVRMILRKYGKALSDDESEADKGKTKKGRTSPAGSQSDAELTQKVKELLKEGGIPQDESVGSDAPSDLNFYVAKYCVPVTDSEIGESGRVSPSTSQNESDVELTRKVAELLKEREEVLASNKHKTAIPEENVHTKVTQEESHSSQSEARSLLGSHTGTNSTDRSMKVTDLLGEDVGATAKPQTPPSYVYDDPSKSMSINLAAIVSPERPEQSVKRDDGVVQGGEKADTLSDRVRHMLSDSAPVSARSVASSKHSSHSGSSINYDYLQKELDEIQAGLEVLQNGDMFCVELEHSRHSHKTATSSVASLKVGDSEKGSESEAEFGTPKRYTWDYAADLGVSKSGEGRFIGRRKDATPGDDDTEHTDEDRAQTPVITDPRTDVTDETHLSRGYFESRDTRYSAFSDIAANRHEPRLTRDYNMNGLGVYHSATEHLPPPPSYSSITKHRDDKKNEDDSFSQQVSVDIYLF